MGLGRTACKPQLLAGPNLNNPVQKDRFRNPLFPGILMANTRL